jgi:hypothetical protein
LRNYVLDQNQQLRYSCNIYPTICNVTQFILSENCSICFGCIITHLQERKQLYLQHLLFVTPLLLPDAIAAGSNNGVTNTRCCRYSCLRSWRWVIILPETCRRVFK